VAGIAIGSALAGAVLTAVIFLFLCKKRKPAAATTEFGEKL
jgi:uncharacterized MnhB-related membrane protein